MSRPGVSITWNPDPVVFRDAILTVERGLRETTLPMQFASEHVQADIRERFQTKTDPDGLPWPPWSEKYRPVAEAHPNIDMLRRDDDLYQAATSEDALIVTPDTLFYDASDLPEYGPWHQSGLPDRRTKQGTPNPLPRRAFLGLSTEAEVLIFATFADWFDNVIDLYETRLHQLGRRWSKRGGNPSNVGQFSPR